jgi:hypothetical protein
MFKRLLSSATDGGASERGESRFCTRFGSNHGYGYVTCYLGAARSAHTGVAVRLQANPFHLVGWGTLYFLKR